MGIKNVCEYISGNPYPGRGILVGKSESGSTVIAYFIMGRSENSRNRVFQETADGIRTRAFDETKVQDPSLIIYNPVRELGGVTIVTNGDQTDTIYDYIKSGETFEEALNTRTFEPDSPNFTPRISAIVERDFYKLSILKSEFLDETLTRRNFFNYCGERPGAAHIIHTYEEDGNPLPSFMGEPRQVLIEGEIDEFTSALWSALNEDNRISLFVRFIGENGAAETRIINKNI